MKFARHKVALNRGNQEAALIKLDIINEVVNRTGITKTKAEMAVETVFESMKRALGRSERIELREGACRSKQSWLWSGWTRTSGR